MGAARDGMQVAPANTPCDRIGMCAYEIADSNRKSIGDEVLCLIPDMLVMRSLRPLNGNKKDGSLRLRLMMWMG